MVIGFIQKNNKYPYIGIYTKNCNEQVVVFFIKENTGFCMKDTCICESHVQPRREPRINRMRTTWSEANFERI